MGSHAASELNQRFRLVPRAASEGGGGARLPLGTEVVVRVEWAGVALRTVRVADGESFRLGTAPEPETARQDLTLLFAMIAIVYVGVSVAAGIPVFGLLGLVALFGAAVVWQLRRWDSQRRYVLLPEDSLGEKAVWELVRVRRGRAMVFVPSGARAFVVNGVDRDEECGVILAAGHDAKVTIGRVTLGISVIPAVASLPRGRPFRELTLSTVAVGVAAAPALLFALPGPGGISHGSTPPERDAMLDIVHVSSRMPWTHDSPGVFVHDEPPAFGDPALLPGKDGIAPGFGGGGLAGPMLDGLPSTADFPRFTFEWWAATATGLSRVDGAFGSGDVGVGTGSLRAGCGRVGPERVRVSLRLRSVSVAGGLRARNVRAALARVEPAIAYCMAHDEFEPSRARRSRFELRLAVDPAREDVEQDTPAQSDRASAFACVRCVLATVPLSGLQGGSATVRYEVRNR